MILLKAKTCQAINEIFILYFVFCIHTLHVKSKKESNDKELEPESKSRPQSI